ncbi:hypothetical protein CEUSTIGMA_g5054.t1 [Chlamydomonas eustigma]|uniref:Uncharacterized protein n=1 Tax=Chlamydomonas eustigma TaxID=1157962 RepID=A0A250X4C7_9CHLO|nr:hypothetical protein CEUSTIGMA_g5054.t1 [Chlamydomonas eustigma]|eukprot:GAX77610.1 hypothetical protein CEUSTIGMA_g5054.t1 [Chlamydomonas eustigma]
MNVNISDTWRLLYRETAQAGYKLGKRVVLKHPQPHLWNSVLEVLSQETGLCHAFKLGQYLSDSHASELSAVMSTNCWLSELDLSGNMIHEEGAMSLAKMLEKNTTMTSLDLTGNPCMSETPRVLSQIKVLLLRNQQLKSELRRSGSISSPLARSSPRTSIAGSPRPSFPSASFAAVVKAQESMSKASPTAMQSTKCSRLSPSGMRSVRGSTQVEQRLDALEERLKEVLGMSSLFQSPNIHTDWLKSSAAVFCSLEGRVDRLETNTGNEALATIISQMAVLAERLHLAEQRVASLEKVTSAPASRSSSTGNQSQSSSSSSSCDERNAKSESSCDERNAKSESIQQKGGRMLQDANVVTQASLVKQDEGGITLIAEVTEQRAAPGQALAVKQGSVSGNLEASFQQGELVSGNLEASFQQGELVASGGGVPAGTNSQEQGSSAADEQEEVPKSVEESRDGMMVLNLHLNEELDDVRDASVGGESCLSSPDQTLVRADAVGGGGCDVRGPGVEMLYAEECAKIVGLCEMEQDEGVDEGVDEELSPLSSLSSTPSFKGQGLGSTAQRELQPTAPLPTAFMSMGGFQVYDNVSVQCQSGMLAAADSDETQLSRHQPNAELSVASSPGQALVGSALSALSAMKIVSSQDSAGAASSSAPLAGTPSSSSGTSSCLESVKRILGPQFGGTMTPSSDLPYHAISEDTTSPAKQRYKSGGMLEEDGFEGEEKDDESTDPPMKGQEEKGASISGVFWHSNTLTVQESPGSEKSSRPCDITSVEMVASANMNSLSSSKSASHVDAEDANNVNTSKSASYVDAEDANNVNTSWPCHLRGPQGSKYEECSHNLTPIASWLLNQDKESSQAGSHGVWLQQGPTDGFVVVVGSQMKDSSKGSKNAVANAGPDWVEQHDKTLLITSCTTEFRVSTSEDEVAVTDSRSEDPAVAMTPYAVSSLHCGNGSSICNQSSTPDLEVENSHFKAAPLSGQRVTPLTVSSWSIPLPMLKASDLPLWKSPPNHSEIVPQAVAAELEEEDMEKSPGVQKRLQVTGNQQEEGSNKLMLSVLATTIEAVLLPLTVKQDAEAPASSVEPFSFPTAITTAYDEMAAPNLMLQPKGTEPSSPAHSINSSTASVSPAVTNKQQYQGKRSAKDTATLLGKHHKQGTAPVVPNERYMSTPCSLNATQLGAARAAAAKTRKDASTQQVKVADIIQPHVFLHEPRPRSQAKAQLCNCVQAPQPDTPQGAAAAAARLVADQSSAIKQAPRPHQPPAAATQVPNPHLASASTVMNTLAQPSKPTSVAIMTVKGEGKNVVKDASLINSKRQLVKTKPVGQGINQEADKSTTSQNPAAASAQHPAAASAQNPGAKMPVPGASNQEAKKADNEAAPAATLKHSKQSTKPTARAYDFNQPPRQTAKPAAAAAAPNHAAQQDATAAFRGFSYPSTSHVLPVSNKDAKLVSFAAAHSHATKQIVSAAAPKQNAKNPAAATRKVASQAAAAPAPNVGTTQAACVTAAAAPAPNVGTTQAACVTAAAAPAPNVGTTQAACVTAAATAAPPPLQRHLASQAPVHLTPRAPVIYAHTSRAPQQELPLTDATGRIGLPFTSESVPPKQGLAAATASCLTKGSAESSAMLPTSGGLPMKALNHNNKQSVKDEGLRTRVKEKDSTQTTADTVSFRLEEAAAAAAGLSEGKHKGVLQGTAGGGRQGGAGTSLSKDVVEASWKLKEGGAPRSTQYQVPVSKPAVASRKWV